MTELGSKFVELFSKAMVAVVIACLLGITIVFIVSFGYAIWKVIKHRIDNR